MKKIFTLLMLAAITYVVAVLVHTGAFRGVDISQTIGPEMHMLYSRHVGPFHEISKTIETVEKKLADMGLNCRVSFGEFLDDPETVEESRLRSNVGCLSNAQPSQLPEGVNYQRYQERDFVRAVFTGSPAIGAFKVYPKAKDYIEEIGKQISGPIIETYTIHSGSKMTTRYYFPVSDG